MRQHPAYSYTDKAKARAVSAALPQDGDSRGMARLFFLLLCALCLMAVQGCASKKPGNGAPEMPSSMKEPQNSQGTMMGALPVKENGTATYNGKKVPLREVTRPDVGVAMPDGNGGVVWMPVPPQGPEAGYMDARELRLKMRELADQLISGIRDHALASAVALPTSFVHQDDFEHTSSFGRFVSEQLFYEFNQRGFPVREYRLAGALKTNKDGEFLLSRAVAAISAKDPNSVFVVGTYYADRQAVFVNARLVRGNGQVLRTAQLVMAPNELTRRMLGGAGGKKMQAGSIGIRDYKSTTQPTNLTPIDKGEDIH